MLPVVGAVVAVTAIEIIIRVRMRQGPRAARLGSVSEQWLNEYRSAHPGP